MIVRILKVMMLIVVLVPGVVRAENISLRVIKGFNSLPFQSFRLTQNVGAYLYGTGRRGLVRLNWKTGRRTEFDTGSDTGFIGSVNDEALLLTVQRKDGEANPTIYYSLFSPTTKKTVRVKVERGFYMMRRMMFDYQNGLMLYTGPYGRSPYGSVHVFNAKTGAYKPFGYGQQGPVVAVSRDHQHMVAGMGSYTVLSIPDDAVSGSFGPSGPIQTPAFVSNSLVFDGKWLRELTGKKVAAVSFTGLPGPFLRIQFSPDLTRALAQAYPPGSQFPKTYYVDSTAFRNYIERLGYLFHPTTGVMTSSEVNFRQYPNLKAKVIGTLNTGEKLIVLDRSGSKQKIEGYDSYWYKVKTSGGTVGWMYGAFIDLRRNRNLKAR